MTREQEAKKLSKLMGVSIEGARRMVAEGITARTFAVPKPTKAQRAAGIDPAFDDTPA